MFAARWDLCQLSVAHLILLVSAHDSLALINGYLADPFRFWYRATIVEARCFQLLRLFLRHVIFSCSSKSRLSSEAERGHCDEALPSRSGLMGVDFSRDANALPRVASFRTLSYVVLSLYSWLLLQ
jgi:hypothetical protein